MGTVIHRLEAHKDFGLFPIPKYLPYDPDQSIHFGLLVNIAFGLFSTFTSSNLFYSQPLLIELAKSFRVTYDEVSRIPTLVQAGYATALVLISPLGDLFRRRPLTLVVVAISASLTIGLSITSKLSVFEALSYLIGVFSVTPQILLPFAVDLVPASRRSSTIAIILAGVTLGMLSARVFAGVVTEFRSYRVVYYYAIGVQSLVLLGAYFTVPDHPRRNKGLPYWRILWTMAKFTVTEPILIQGCLILICLNASFSNFWVTLTFLLGGPPYDFSTLSIGLFGLVGIFGVAVVPIGGLVMDRFVPWYGALASVLLLLVFQSIQLGAGGINIGAVIVAAFGIDLFTQMIQVSVTTTIYGISVEARSRFNAIALVSTFIGRVMGTSVGTHIYLQYGWRIGARFSLGLVGCMVLILVVRGPHTTQYRWFGYEGGMEWRKEKTAVPDAMDDDRNQSTSNSLITDMQEVFREISSRREEKSLPTEE